MLPGQGRAWQLSPGSRDQAGTVSWSLTQFNAPAAKGWGSKDDGTDVPPVSLPPSRTWQLPSTLTSLGLTCIPVEGVLTPEGSQHPLPAVQEREGDGWEASGWQAGAAGQGKHGACNARDLEITLSYKGKKVQAR